MRITGLLLAIIFIIILYTCLPTINVSDRGGSGQSSRQEPIPQQTVQQQQSQTPTPTSTAKIPSTPLPKPVDNDIETYGRLREIIGQCANNLHQAVETPTSPSDRTMYYALPIVQMNIAIEKELDMSSKRRKKIMAEIKDTMTHLLNAYIKEHNKRLVEGGRYLQSLDEKPRDSQHHTIKLIELTHELVKPGGVKGAEDYELIQEARKSGLIRDTSEWWVRQLINKVKEIGK